MGMRLTNKEVVDYVVDKLNKKKKNAKVWIVATMQKEII